MVVVTSKQELKKAKQGLAEQIEVTGAFAYSMYLKKMYVLVFCVIAVLSILSFFVVLYFSDQLHFIIDLLSAAIKFTGLMKVEWAIIGIVASTGLFAIFESRRCYLVVECSTQRTLLKRVIKTD